MEAIPHEHELMSKFKEGDAHAFQEIHQLYFPLMCFFAEKIVRSAEDAKDIASEVFAKLWARHDKFDTLINVKAFLYITTRNLCLNYLRKTQVRKQADQELPTPASEDPRPAIALAETYRDAYQLIKTLRKKQRQVIEMMLEGYSTAEIALKLQQQESNIRKIKFRALNEIREKLKKIS